MLLAATRNSTANESMTYEYDDEYVYNDYSDVKQVTECTCSIGHKKECDKEMQFRTREPTKEGTIGGKFCNPSLDKTLEAQLCICKEGKYNI